MATVHNLKGTSVSSFQIGKQGPLVKNSSGQIDIRNTGDTAFSTLKAGDLHIDTTTGAIQLESLYTDVKEPTGFPNRTDTTLSFAVGTREFSIAPTGASFDVYIHGRKINVVGTQTLAISNSTGSHFLYIDSAGTLQETTTFSTALYSDNAICGIVYWNAVAGTAPYVADERHGVTMDFDTHSYLHNVLGSQWISGLTPGSILSDQDGSNNTHAQLDISDGVIADEDIRISITDGSPEDLSPVLTAPVFYRDGLSWVKDAAAVYPVKTGGTGRLAYNSFSTPNWGQTEIANNKFVLCHLMATNDIYYPVIALQGIAQYDTISAANSGASTELLELSGLPFAEFVPICTLVFQTSDSYTNAVKARIRQLDSGDDFIDWRQSHFKLLFSSSSSGGTSDHANLTNLQGGTAGSYYHSDQPINTTDNVDFASVQVAAGSAASPSLSFSTDTNTGLYLSAADTIGFSANGTLLGTWSATGITIAGDLTVQGTTTTIDTTTLLVEDKNIELGVVAVPSDVTADGGGITLKGATDKSISWVNATDAWTSSEHVYLASGKQFQADAGTVSLPGYTFNSDLNSGLYSLGANRIGVSTDGVLRLEATATGSLVLGTGAVATNATDGFLYVPGTAGTPTGTPTAYTGRYPSIFDSTNEYSYTWNGSSWIKTKNTTDRIVQIGEGGNTDTLDDLVSWMWATGTISGQVLTDNGNGTVDITAGTMYIKTTASDLGDLVKVSTPAGTALALTDNSVNYIYVDYNGGAPTLNVTTNVLAFDGLNKVILYKMGRSGNTITVLDVRFQSINPSRKNRRILYESTVYTKQKGKTLIAEAGTRNLTVTEGAFYYGYEKISHAAFDTTVAGVANANVFSYYYQDGIGGWTESTNQKQISNSLYDDGSGTLAAMTANYHRVDHVYIILDRTTPRLVVVYGDAEYPVLASAQAASEPTSLPPLIAATGVVIGRVIVKQGQAALSEVNNATLTGIERQIATDHNEFADIQGGSAGNYYHSNQAINTTDSPTFANALIGGVDFNGVLTAVKDPTGFPNRTDSVFSFVDGTRTFSISPVGASFDIYIKGVKYTKSTAQSVVIPNVSGPYYIYFDTAGTIQYTGTFTSDLITTYVYVAALYWNATSGTLVNLGDERHSCQMDQATHSYLHNVFGTRYGTGLQIGNYTTAGTGNTNSDARLSITSGVIWDEDIRIAITDDPTPATNSFEQILSTAARLPIVYRSGTGTTNWYKSTATDYPLKMGTTLPQYNLNTAGTWSTPDTPTTNFLAMWIFATHDVREPVVALMGQRYDSTLANAQANATYESLDLAGLPATEWKFLYRLIFETRTTYSNAVKSRLRDVTDYRTASLQGSATGASSSHSALSGLTDTNSHPASAISTIVTSFAGVLSTSDTDVQTALDTIDNHVHPVIVGTTAVTSGTVGALLFEGTGNVVQEDAANLFWDDTNNRLGIGTNAPDVLLHSETNTDGTVTNRIKNTDVGTNVLVRHAMTSSTGTASLDLYGANNSTAIGGMAMNNATVLQGVNGGDVMIRGVGTSDVWFTTNNVISAGLSSGGNFLIGSTTDDTVNKLQVTGSAKITSDLTVQAEIYAGSGAVGTPSYSFGSDTNTGFYSIGADQIGVAIGGVNVATFSSTGLSATMTNIDNTFTIQDNGDSTKKVAFECSGITTGTTRTLTVPNASGTIATVDDALAYAVIGW